MIKFFKNIKLFLVDMFTQNENVGLVTLEASRKEVNKFVVEKTSDSDIYNLFK